MTFGSSWVMCIARFFCAASLPTDRRGLSTSYGAYRVALTVGSRARYRAPVVAGGDVGPQGDARREPAGAVVVSAVARLALSNRVDWSRSGLRGVRVSDSCSSTVTMTRLTRRCCG